LWTVHPKYLDCKGLLALWRESLLAQAVLRGKTKGWRNHPQLDRFKGHPDSISAIGFYLHHIYVEGNRRGYGFKKDKIHRTPSKVSLIKISKEWVSLEFKQLKQKLRTRSPRDYRKLLSVRKIDLHPVFQYAKND